QPDRAAPSHRPRRRIDHEEQGQASRDIERRLHNRDIRSKSWQPWQVILARYETNKEWITISSKLTKRPWPKQPNSLNSKRYNSIPFCVATGWIIEVVPIQGDQDRNCDRAPKREIASFSEAKHL